MADAVEIKICGLVSPAQAAACAGAGADAIGVVFHPPSPRHVTPAAAREIVAALPPRFPVVGVFAHAAAAAVLETARAAGIGVVQLHTPATPADHAALTAAGLHVVQTLSLAGAALRAAAAALPPALGVLVECGRGVLPGGNAASWDWSGAAVLRGLRPFAVAGGLDPRNVAAALALSGADAVDVSSGVEQAPGVKDPARVRDFVAAVRAAARRGAARPVFCRPPPGSARIAP